MSFTSMPKVDRSYGHSPLPPSWRRDQDREPRLAHQLLGEATHEAAPQPTARPRAHNDQIRPFLGGDLTDHGSWIASRRAWFGPMGHAVLDRKTRHQPRRRITARPRRGAGASRAIADRCAIAAVDMDEHQPHAEPVAQLNRRRECITTPVTVVDTANHRTWHSVSSTFVRLTITRPATRRHRVATPSLPGSARTDRGNGVTTRWENGAVPAIVEARSIPRRGKVPPAGVARQGVR